MSDEIAVEWRLRLVRSSMFARTLKHSIAMESFIVTSVASVQLRVNRD